MVGESRITHFERDGLTFELGDSGPLEGPVAVLLHGWPQDASSWDRVVPLLNEQGFRTLVPTLRGAAPSVAPKSRWAYRKAVVRDDVIELIEQLGRPVHLVGHDWGAVVAWSLATHRPELLSSLTAVSAPHFGAFVRAAVRSRQLLASWYMVAFQVPLLPQLLLRRTNIATRLLVDAGQEPELARRDATRMRDKRVLTGGLNYYRSLIGDVAEARGRTAVPTLQVWGDADAAITRAAVEQSKHYATGAYELLVLAGASHWVPEAAPDALVTALATHFRQSGAELPRIA